MLWIFILDFDLQLKNIISFLPPCNPVPSVFTIARRAKVRYVVLVTPYNLVLVLLLAGGLFALLVLRRKAGQRPSRRLERQVVIRRAAGVRYLGLESEGANAVRGPGTLTLAGDGLHFQARTERREVFIPSSSIVYLGSTLSFKERNLEREILIVHYLSSQGSQEAAGFQVPVPGRWVAAFKAGLPARNPGPSRKPHGNRS
jgi:hypothetical protein